MKIAILVGGLPPLYNGGTEIATIKIAEYATKAGHEVHVIAADGNNGKREYKMLENGFKVHRVKTIPPHYLHGMTYIPSAVIKILQINPDLVHAQAVYMSPSAYIVNKLRGIPYILYERGGIYLNYFMAKYARKLFFGNAYRVIAQTEHQKSALLKYVNRDIEVIPNGIDADRFGKLSKCEARAKLGLSQDKKIVLSVGRCRPEKNLKNFVRAARLGSKDFLYVLVGEGQELNELRSMAKDSVMFIGGVNNNDVPLYMSAADVLVNTSLSEGFPVALLEGLASGLPIVAPRVCGIPEIIEDGVNGILTMPNDYESTARAIDIILSDDRFADKMSRANIVKARGYTLDNVVKRLYG